MVWTIVITIVVISAGLVLVMWRRKMNVPREPDREAPQDEAAVRAYNCIGHWPIFVLERHIVLKAIAGHKIQGIVMDIGCGPGFMTARINQRYPSLKLIGFDINPTMIDIARHNWPAQHNNSEFVIGDAHYLPFADDTIDFVVSSLSLHHWEDGGMVFREIHRILKPGGKFLVFDLRRDSSQLFYYALRLGQALLAPPAIQRTNGAVGSFWASYTPSEIKALLSRIAFERVCIDTSVGWMLVWGCKTEKRWL